MLKDHCTGRLRRPWALQPNGDLTRLLFRFVRAKGPHAVAFAKVKGHATLADINENKSTHDNKYGNDKSDAAAAKGVMLIHPGLPNIINWYTQRHKQYCQFMQAIHNI